MQELMLHQFSWIWFTEVAVFYHRLSIFHDKINEKSPSVASSLETLQIPMKS
jgi:hypothetical protein